LRGKAYKKLFGLLISVAIALCAGTLCHAETAAVANRVLHHAEAAAMPTPEQWVQQLFCYLASPKVGKI